MVSNPGLSERNLFRLQTLGPLSHHECDSVSLFERAVTASFDGGKVHKYIFPVLARNKSKSLAGVKPLHRSCFFHVSTFLAMEGPADRLTFQRVAKAYRGSSKDVLGDSIAIGEGSTEPGCSAWSHTRRSPKTQYVTIFPSGHGSRRDAVDQLCCP